MYNWSDVRMSDVRAINTRLGLAKFHNWQKDIASWSSEKTAELARYEQMLTDIERDWSTYGNDVQEFYDAVSLCYLLLGGKMTGVNIDEEIARLTKIYYKVED